MVNKMKLNYKTHQKRRKIKKKEERGDKYVYAISFIYLLVLVLMLVTLIIWVASVDEKNAFLKSGVATLITLIFGTSSKSLYAFLLYIPYNFDKAEFEKNKENKILEHIGSAFADLMLGITLLIYVAKIAGMPSTGNMIVILIVFVMIVISFFIVRKVALKNTVSNDDK